VSATKQQKLLEEKVEDFMMWTYEVSKMNHDLFCMAERSMRLRPARTKWFAVALLVVMVLPSAYAQSITPLYGAFAGPSGEFKTESQYPGAQGTQSIAALNPASLPGWVVETSCYDSGSQWSLLVAVWQDRDGC
jgi:hypothetical protein